MDISDVARRSGVPASTLRFYEEKRLIASIGRRGLRRVFGPDVFERLGLIALGRAAGFSLDEIAGMFGPDGRPRAKPHAVPHLPPPAPSRGVRATRRKGQQEDQPIDQKIPR